MDLKDKKIIITGGGGFLGQHVIKKLNKDGVPTKNIFSPRSKKYDLRKKSSIEKMFNDFPAEIVIHLAANCGGIGYNQKNPATLLEDNVLMNTQIISQARKRNIEKFVALGTVCAYPKFTPTPFKEEYLWEGYPEETNAPYGIAKKLMLVQTQANRDQYGFNAIYLLPVNLYGPGDVFGERAHVIPDLIYKFSKAKTNNKKSVTLWGDGTPTREFLYVKDAAKGIVLATKDYNEREPINLGSGDEISIKKLAEKISKIIGFSREIKWDTSKPNGQPKRMLDTSKAEKLFGFKSQTSLEQGLRETINWYKNNN